MLRRRMLLKGGLPNGYKKLEYIASANGAYIDSGLYGSNTLDFEIVAYSDLTSIQCFFGDRLKGETRSYLLLYDYYNRFYQFDIENSSQHYTNLTNNVVASKKGNVLTLNGVSVTQGMNAYTTPQHLYILGLNHNGQVKFNVKGARIYSLNFSENGTLIRDYIPARRLSDNKVGLYDKVGKKFYISATSVNFIGSDEVQTTSIEDEIISDEVEDTSTDFVPEYSGQAETNNNV